MRVWLLVVALAGCGAADDQADGATDLASVVDGGGGDGADDAGEDASAALSDGSGGGDGMDIVIGELGVTCVPSARQCTAVESCCPVVGCVAIDGGDCP